MQAVKEYAILGLFQEGRISEGKAAELLGLTRRGFIALLARRGIDYFRFGLQEWDSDFRMSVELYERVSASL